MDPSFISLSTFIFSKAFFSLQSRRLHLALPSPSQTGALGCLLTGQRLTALEGAPGCGACGLRASLWAAWAGHQLGNLGSRIFRSLPWSGHVPRVLFSSGSRWPGARRGQHAACGRCIVCSRPAAEGQSSPVSGCPTPHPLVYSHQTTLQMSAEQRDQERDPQAGSQQGSWRSGSSPVFTDFDSPQAMAAPAPEPQTRRLSALLS